jgi:hypothetical protein
MGDATRRRLRNFEGRTTVTVQGWGAVVIGILFGGAGLIPLLIGIGMDERQHHNLGVAHLHLGKREEALAQHEILQTLNPQQADKLHALISKSSFWRAPVIRLLAFVMSCCIQLVRSCDTTIESLS